MLKGTSTGTTTYNLRNIQFAGNTNDIRVDFPAGATIEINILDSGDTPSIDNVNGSTVNVNADTQITLTGLVNDTEISVFDSGDGSEIAHIEDVVGNAFAFTDVAANVVDIFIHKEDYYRADILNFTIPASDASIPIQQRFDPNYQNP